jgi:hypothetical protein
MSKVWCPGCDQGWVVPVEVRKTKERLFVCEECESTWLSEDGISREPAENFVNHMRAEGLHGLWTELEELTVDS